MGVSYNCRSTNTHGKMAPKILHVLYEHASGYALFRVKEFEEVAMLQPELEESVSDLSRFNSVVKLEAFAPFKSGANALDNINSVSEGVLHEDLRLFLETNVPKGGKKEKCTLGIGDSKLASAIAEEMGLSCQHTGVVPEIIRGIRCHFHKMIKGLTEMSASKAQLGLGHSYSRAKVKFNVHRVDNMIIQRIALLDQLDKDVNTFSMRIREWYSYHFPEMVKIVNDNYLYAQLAKFIGDRKTLTQEKVEGMEEILMDSAKAQAVYDASKASMGMDISAIDLINVARFAGRVIALAEYRKGLHEYLKEKMSQCAPSLSALIGEQVGARLISHAGSLTNLAKYPASTVQILGAEKALFRALKKKGNTPKYGLIFHSSFIGRAGSKNKGRISRYLANKCPIACRMDCFSDEPTAVVGQHLKKQVEDRLNFFETGAVPDKNIDVMKKAVEQIKESEGGKQEMSDDDDEVKTEIKSEEQIKKEKKEKKKAKKDKKKKRKQEEAAAAEDDAAAEAESDEPVK